MRDRHAIVVTRDRVTRAIRRIREARVERDRLRGENARLRAALERIGGMDWPVGHAITAARDMKQIARAALAPADQPGREGA